MSDIVERLNECKSGPNEFCVVAKTIIDEAATEIESLRAQLASIRQVAGAVSLESGLTFGEIKGTIGKAHEQ